MFAMPSSRSHSYAPRGQYRYIYKIYNSTGAYTWQAPRDLEPWTPVKATVIGAGGAGGSVATTASTASVGGSSGGCAIKIFVGKFARCQRVTATVGQGGVPGAAGANPGGAGSDSTFSTLTGTGGTGGLAGSTSAQAGTGVTGTGGDINIPGGIGSCTQGGGTTLIPSKGGDTPFFYGFGATPPVSNNAGRNGGPGSGGSGVSQTASAGTARQGGAGKDGLIIIELWTADPAYVATVNI